jgi:hypothetical protein
MSLPVTVAIRALDLAYLDKIIDSGRSSSRYILPTRIPNPPKIPSDSDSDPTALVGIPVPPPRSPVGLPT